MRNSKGRAGAQTHLLQLYNEDIGVLARNAAAYVCEGLKLGEPALLVAMPAHLEAFWREFERNGVSADDAERTGKLVTLDASETLSRIVRYGRPDRNRFRQVIGVLADRIRRQTGASRIRAYGEMVGLLWNAGQSAAALRLEELWNEWLAGAGASLFCAYQIDVFGHEFQAAVAGPIIDAHTHLLTGFGPEFEPAIRRALSDVVGPQDWPARQEGSVPAAESAVLWVRGRYPAAADEVLDRARGYLKA
jgi:hypothetical protein